MKNINNKFPPETLNVLDAFSIFNIKNMPGVESYDFQMYCSREINVLADHYYIDDDLKKDALEKEFDSFKFELTKEEVEQLQRQHQIKQAQAEMHCYRMGP